MKKIDEILLESGLLQPDPKRRTEYGYVYEGGLSRVLQHTKNPFAIITAFRKNYSLKQNRQRNNKLESDLKKNRAGGIKLIGHWKEGPNGMEYEDAEKQGLLEAVTEESYFIPKPNDIEYEDFETLILGLTKKYKQDAAVISDGKAVYELFNTGRKKEIGTKVTFSKMGEIYSQMRGQPSRTFMFEGSIQPINVSSRRLFRDLGLLWLTESGMITS